MGGPDAATSCGRSYCYHLASSSLAFAVAGGLSILLRPCSAWPAGDCRTLSRTNPTGTILCDAGVVVGTLLTAQTDTIRCAVRLHAIRVEVGFANLARMVSGGMKCVKYLLFVFNLIFFLAGLGLVALGAVAQVKFNEYSAFFGGEVNLPAIFLIVTGSVIFVISFFGCVGAYKENYCMVCTYAVLLGFVLLLEIIVVFLAYILNIQIYLVKPLENTMFNYLSPKHEILTSSWNHSQAKLHCCGVHNYRDWVVNPILNQTGSVPDSCCLVRVEKCGLGLASTAGNVTKIYTEGCFDKVVYWAGEHNPYIRGAVAGLGVLELLCVVFACCLARSILREYEAV